MSIDINFFCKFEQPESSSLVYRIPFFADPQTLCNFYAFTLVRSIKLHCFVNRISPRSADTPPSGVPPPCGSLSPTLCPKMEFLSLRKIGTRQMEANMEGWRDWWGYTPPSPIKKLHRHPQLSQQKWAEFAIKNCVKLILRCGNNGDKIESAWRLIISPPGEISRKYICGNCESRVNPGICLKIKVSQIHCALPQILFPPTMYLGMPVPARRWSRATPRFRGAPRFPHGYRSHQDQANTIIVCPHRYRQAPSFLQIFRSKANLRRVFGPKHNFFTGAPLGIEPTQSFAMASRVLPIDGVRVPPTW